MPLNRLWVAMLTKYIVDADTDSEIMLSINIDGRDHLLHEIFPDSDQLDQEVGQANLYELNIKNEGIEPSLLTNSSIRLDIRGQDAWSPEHFFAWGEMPPRTALDNPKILPLVIETEIARTLSTDISEGASSIPLRLVKKGSSNMRINRLLILLITKGSQEDNKDSRRPDAIEIQIVSNDRLMVLCEIYDTHSQDDLGIGAANFYTMPVIIPFTKSDLNNHSITLRAKGGYGWLPASFFLFGMDATAGRPKSMAPLVHLPEWPFGFLSPDITNGIASVTLPLVFDNSLTGDLEGNDAILLLSSIEAEQQKTNQLLEQLLAKIK